MPNPKAEVAEAEIYSPESLQRLTSILWNSRDEPKTLSVLLYVVFGAFAGLRPAEAVELEWKQVDWAKNEIRLAASGVKPGRVIPMKDNLLSFLIACKTLS
jgi:integrase